MFANNVSTFVKRGGCGEYAKVKRTLLLVLLLLPTPSQAHPLKKVGKVLLRVAEHVTLGAGTEVAVSQVAGGPRYYGAGLAATAMMAGIKEGNDAIDGKDTRRQAAIHALTILAGAGMMAAIRH